MRLVINDFNLMANKRDTIVFLGAEHTFYMTVDYESRTGLHPQSICQSA